MNEQVRPLGCHLLVVVLRFVAIPIIEDSCDCRLECGSRSESDMGGMSIGRHQFSSSMGLFRNASLAFGNGNSPTLLLPN